MSPDINAQSLKRAAEKFLELRSGLFPDLIEQASQLKREMLDPTTADANACWMQLLDKPLWTNAKATGVNKKLAEVRKALGTRWQEMAANDGTLRIRKIKGGHHCANDSYEINAEVAQLLSTTKIARFRFYRMAAAARVLHCRAKDNESPFAYLTSMCLEDAINDLRHGDGQGRRKGLGDGWGAITTMHFLTDLGLSCKPDRQLMRALSHLSLFPPLKSVPSLKQAIEADKVVKALTTVVGNISLREMDFLLMQIGIDISQKSAKHFSRCHSTD